MAVKNITSSPLTKVAPQVKLAAALLFITGVAITPRRAIWVFAIDALILLLGFRFAGLTFRYVAKRFFVLVPLVPAVCILPFIASGETVHYFALALSVEGLWGSWNIVAKAGLGFATSLLLLSTTSVPAILSGLSKLRLPPLIISIVASMLRYLDIVVDETSRTRQAMASRGYSPKWFWQVKPLALSVGVLFVRSFERAERVHIAMLARGFQGVMPISSVEAAPKSWLLICWAPAVAFLMAFLAVTM